jgi:hypothetical protein
MAEAMSTGTPVITLRAGSAPEVVEDGVTGWVCDSLTAMVAAVERVARIDRRACRARVEQQFSPAVMADAYERVYTALLERPPAVAAISLGWSVNGHDAAFAMETGATAIPSGDVVAAEQPTTYGDSQ